MALISKASSLPAGPTISQVIRASDEVFATDRCGRCLPELGRAYSETDDATIFCTSGTTDKPKNFLIDHLAHWSFGMSTH